MRVLLVEDDTATANPVESMLKSDGYDCDCTELGEMGLEIGQLNDYDLIILDLTLPDMDGYELLRRLLTALVQTPILILSNLPGSPARHVRFYTNFRHSIPVGDTILARPSRDGC